MTQLTPAQLLNQLQWELNGTEPCATEFDADGKINDPDKWTGAWTESTNPVVAAELCAGCHVIDKCGEYAIVAEEPSFIWGGLTTQQRKVIHAARRRESKKASHRFTKDTNGTYKTT